MVRKKVRCQRRDSLKDWYIGPYDRIVAIKLGHMTLNGFETLLTNFASKFENVKGLAMNSRDLLFLREANCAQRPQPETNLSCTIR